ncbi:protein of unknown function [Kyrpidia spormannii]|uniref:Uncharacterized protein n=1 Tax=Kyrpidia spormannii TaxID=2055160 RepID=A0A6F9EHZ3_9BACL|nr:protein of unknown function [Kyrpidia spormannii]
MKAQVRIVRRYEWSIGKFVLALGLAGIRVITMDPVNPPPH